MSLIPPSAPGAAQKDFRPRLFWATGVVVLAVLTLIGRLYYLQILHGEDYLEQATENSFKELRIPADRGLIVDRNRKVLVDSRPSYDVTLTPAFCGKGKDACLDVLDRAAAVVSMAPEEVARAKAQLPIVRVRQAWFKPFTIKVDISREELDRFLAQQGDLPGVDVQPTPHRHYRYGPLGGHLIGYMNEVGDDELKRYNDGLRKGGSGQPLYQLGDYVGRRGLEYRFEPFLRGTDGAERVPVDAKGRRKPEAESLIPEEYRLVQSKPGNNLVLSLDWRLQEFAEKTFPATAGAVVAMDLRTGFLLVLVDRPSPDPNKMSGRITSAELAAIHSDPLQPELFRAIQQHYHPGSTYKALTSIAALEEGVAHPGTTIYCPGHFQMGRARWRCDKEAGHGWVDFEHALGASCDVFYYSLGAQLGADSMARWARKGGLGQPTGFDIPGEVPGVIPDVAWHDKHQAGGYQKGMAVNLSIGQGDVNVTPMQQAVFYGAIASGTVWRPQVVQRIEDADGKVLKEFAPDPRSRFEIKKSTRDAVMKGLLAAVNQPYGTAYGQRVKEVVLAGKTGTAQVVKLGAKRLRAEAVPYFERDHAWFAAFAPAEDPEIVVVVLNEHSGFGSTNAAPTAVALIKKYLELKALDAGQPSPFAPAPSAAAGAPGAARAAVAAPAAAIPAATATAPGAARAPAPGAARAPAAAAPGAPGAPPRDGAAPAPRPAAKPARAVLPATSPAPLEATPAPAPAVVPAPSPAAPEPVPPAPVEPAPALPDESTGAGGPAAGGAPRGA
ncbi:MAG: penicillin-binding protein 2 [Anaeromyxobacter sp.]